MNYAIKILHIELYRLEGIMVKQDGLNDLDEQKLSSDKYNEIAEKIETIKNFLHKNGY